MWISPNLNLHTSPNPTPSSTPNPNQTSQAAEFQFESEHRSKTKPNTNLLELFSSISLSGIDCASRWSYTYIYIYGSFCYPNRRYFWRVLVVSMRVPQSHLLGSWQVPLRVPQTDPRLHSALPMQQNDDVTTPRYDLNT